MLDVETLQQRDADAVDGYAITGTGLRVLRDLSRTEWAQLGQMIGRRAEGLRWALGDWLVYAGGRAAGTAWIGGGYARAVEITGCDVSVLSAAYATASAFPPDSRDLGLSYTICTRIAQQPEPLRAELVSHCLVRRWTVRDLEEHLQAQRPAHDVMPRLSRRADGKDRRLRPLKRVRCPQCAHEFQVKGHTL